MDRRKFLQSVTALTVLAACGKTEGTELPAEEEKVLLRFALASDIHFGEDKTDYQSQITNLKTHFAAFQKNNPCAFFAINGDIIHNDPAFLPPAHQALKGLHDTIYVTQGNHDRVSDTVWKQTWNCDLNFDVVHGDSAFIFGTTSDVVGSLSCPNMTIMQTLLDKHRDKKHVFIFWHIHPHYQEMNCTDVLAVLSKYPNVRAVFNGHDHNDESVKTIAGIPYLFNGRIAGSWGSFDRNFRVVEVTNTRVITYLMTPTVKKKQTTLTS